MTILVTGATGAYGHHALEVLKTLVPDQEVFALARTQEKADQLSAEGFQTRIGDYFDQESLNTALKGIDRLLFVSSNDLNDRQTQHQNVVKAAQANNVNYIAYTSASKADTPARQLAKDHKFTEELIADAGIDHTFLRNNFYLENEMPILGAALKAGRLVHAAKDGQVGWGTRDEFAEIGARAVSGQFDFPAIIEVGGPLQTYGQLGEALAKATGKDIEIVEGDAEAASTFLQEAGFPKNVADYIGMMQQALQSNSAAVPADDMAKYLGRDMISTEAALRKLFAK
ncbi:nucleoside-diphosphate-sugar epimerase [Fructobacillus pseudoficulneus]|uniref:Nucleoside-diphosphate-sugar epimerase n=1 Tax=Fructobacillus pseudoficulneus TaxID=220714 RepID=A0A3F3H9S1_9LACO|nr:NAD(P)H-binding protein [Fructobacillus pseudoficulneus]GAP02953.1 nucleoside-diphosphate-sugar epimerase [Fructobacillus pseudoficulneus]SEH44868.1 NAD(P)H dehydrogenase (quinone) [Fructobacillus pseudoficulneus]